jgi:hypothetical protein
VKEVLEVPMFLKVEGGKPRDRMNRFGMFSTWRLDVSEVSVFQSLSLDPGVTP